MIENNARFYEPGLNRGITSLRSEDMPRFILGLHFGILSMFSNLGVTWLVATFVIERALDWSMQYLSLYCLCELRLGVHVENMLQVSIKLIKL